MSRIAGVNVPTNKKLCVSLTYIYGIGVNTAEKICKAANVDKDKRTAKLSDDELIKIREVIDESYAVEGELRSETSMNIKKLIDMKSYRGMRHVRKLPVRGQRTHTNARTRKGKAVPIAGKKKV